MARYIDCTPTWEGLLPALLQLAGNPNTQASGVKELRRMAIAADKWNEYCKEETLRQTELRVSAAKDNPS